MLRATTGDARGGLGTPVKAAGAEGFLEERHASRDREEEGLPGECSGRGRAEGGEKDAAATTRGYNRPGV